MPTLVHLTDERNIGKIKKAGIKPYKKGNGIYCMPVLQNFYVSHQWLRELKSNGTKTLVGVYFKVDSSEMVYAGKFKEKHKFITIGEAIQEILALEDPLGYELIIVRKISQKEISKFKHLPQVIGWRYFPGSHNNPPCSCEFCLKGTIKGKRTINRLNKLLLF